MSKDKSTPVDVKRASASGAATGKRGRFSTPRKAEAVLRLLRGEDLELLGGELGVIASTLSLWREQFVAAGQSSLKGKTGKTDERDEQISRLRNVADVLLGSRKQDDMGVTAVRGDMHKVLARICEQPAEVISD